METQGMIDQLREQRQGYIDNLEASKRAKEVHLENIEDVKRIIATSTDIDDVKLHCSYLLTHISNLERAIELIERYERCLEETKNWKI